MSATTFTHTPCGAGSGRLRDSSARLAAGQFLTVSSARYSDRVDLGLHADMLQSYMVFTAEQARALAVELLACADAHDAAKAGAPSHG